MSEDGLKLSAYFGERSRVKGRLLADELLDTCARREILSSILVRGVQGFGAKQRLRTDRLLTLSEDLPLLCIAVDTSDRIRALIVEMDKLEHKGLMTLEHARLHNARCAKTKRIGLHEDAPPATGESSGESDQALKLTIYLGRHQRVDGSPAFLVACQTLRDGGVAGASVLLGVDGTRQGERERARFFARNANVPAMVVSVGHRSVIEQAIQRLRQLLGEPLFTTEAVRVCKRDGLLLDSPHDASMFVAHGVKARQKLTVIVSEAAVHEKRSVYLELLKRMRGAHAAGATSLRGIWGFHGEHVPHGDRLFALRRHVPVVTELVDTPERIAALFPIVDELTCERGLVTSEVVPNSSTLHDLPAYS